MQKMVRPSPSSASRANRSKRIQRRLDAIQPAQVVGLKKVYASLRDGMSVAADWFDPIDGEQQAAWAPSAADKAKDAIRARGKPEPPPRRLPLANRQQDGRAVQRPTSRTPPASRPGCWCSTKRATMLTPTELEDLNRAYLAAWEA